MAESAFVRHELCPECDVGCSSTPNASRYADGSLKCHACGLKQSPSNGQAVSNGPPGRNGPSPPLLEFTPTSMPKRALRRETFAKFSSGVGHVDGEPCQVSTYFTPSSVPCAQKIRFANKRFLWRGFPDRAVLFGQQLWGGPGRMVVVTEGELDALSVSEAQDNRWPVVSVPNGAQSAAKALAAQLSWLSTFERVVLCFDNDAAGIEASLACSQLFDPGRACICRLPLKDASEMIQAGRHRELISSLWEAKPYRPDGLVDGEDLWSYLEDRQPDPHVDWPWLGLQRLTLGWREGEVVVLTGGTKQGKSTAAREIAYSVARQRHRVGYIAIEETIRQSLHGLLTCHLSKPLVVDPSSATVEEVREAFDSAIKDSFALYDHFGSLDGQNLISRLRFLVRGMGCKYLVLDHLSIVVSGYASGDERQQIDRLMTSLVSLAQELKVGVLVLCHLRKAREGDEGFEDGKPVTLSALRGSGSISQLAFTAFAVERTGVRFETRLRLLACRHTGHTGPAGLLAFDPDTGRLSEKDPV